MPSEIKLHKERDFDLRVFRNEDASRWIKEFRDLTECCYQLKTMPLNQAIVSIVLKALITLLIWDEREARADEKHCSP